MEHRRARVGWVGLDGMLSGLEHHMKGFKGGIFSVKFLTRRRTNYVFRPKTLCLGQFLTSHGWISSPQEGIFRLDQMDGDWRETLVLLSQVRLGHCDYFIVHYVQRHVSTNSGLYQALIWLSIGFAFLPGRFSTKNEISIKAQKKWKWNKCPCS